MKLLDLFCGAGGGSTGYSQAGYEVIGVDHAPQPRYPFPFVQADALEFLAGVKPGEYDLIHASPPCQAFCDLRSMWNARQHTDLLTPTRALLKALGTPYVIENVEGAPLLNAIRLCGSSFGLTTREGAALRRHRLFETHPMLVLSPPCVHKSWAPVIGVYGGHGRDRRRKANTQDFPATARREAMGIDWMTGEELSLAIPPVYTRWIGEQMKEALK